MLDLFDKSDTCVQAWDRLVAGFALESLELDSVGQDPQECEVESLLSHLRVSSWESAKAVADGAEHRTESEGKTYGSILECEGALLHASAIRHFSAKR